MGAAADGLEVADLLVDMPALGRMRRADDDQELRFKVLCDIADLSGSSVCDVGCGFGDLLPYLRTHFADITYTGIDISPSLVHKARELHPEVDFHCRRPQTPRPRKSISGDTH